MGIYDRDYYRRDMAEPVEGVPGRTPGLSLTTWLIVINVVALVLSYFLLSMQDSVIADWWKKNLLLWPNFRRLPPDLLGDRPGLFRPWQLVTSVFLHEGFWHILLNMWMLWLFGRGIEQLYGRWNFLAFYLAAGITAGALYVLTSYIRGTPNGALGASGAVIGTVVLYAFHFPRQKLYIWGIVPVLVWQMAAFFVALDLYYFTTGQGGNVANAAHLGGAAFGVAYYYLDLRFESLGRIMGLGKKASRPAVPPLVPPTPRPSASVDPHVRDRVDALLDKISRDGLTSLTDEERDFLRDASGKYRSS